MQESKAILVSAEEKPLHPERSREKTFSEVRKAEEKTAREKAIICMFNFLHIKLPILGRDDFKGILFIN